MLMQPNADLIRTILNWYGVAGVLTAPLVMVYYLYRLNHSDNPWKFADMLMTKNRDGVEKADLSKFSIMIALITGAAAVIYMVVNHANSTNFATLFVTFIGVFSGVQVANGALRVWDNANQKLIVTKMEI